MTKFNDRNSKASRIRRQVLSWYFAEGRTFPWRSNPGPYRVLVAEFLLQRSTSGRVAPIFDQFVALWPTVGSLAEARPDRVAKVIRPLGLPGRGKRMVAAAKHIESHFSGEIPRSLQALESLAGIGIYTATAIRVFAFGRREGLVDSVTARVYRRLFGITEPWNGPIPQNLWQLAATLAPRLGAREFYWGILDIAATICQPRLPRCARCPLDRFCRYKRNEIGSLAD
jgi:A/G-specific adenine glycosylase